jgi:hypothetical protein
MAAVEDPGVLGGYRVFVVEMRVAVACGFVAAVDGLAGMVVAEKPPQKAEKALVGQYMERTG